MLRQCMLRCFITQTRQLSSSKYDLKLNSMVGKNLLTLQKYAPEQIEDLLWTALDMKLLCKSGKSKEIVKLLRGRSIAAIFQKKSTRTRLSFEAGSHALGAHAIFCNKDDIHLGEGESIKDTAIVMSHLCDAITARVYEHNLLDELSRHSKIPIINALSCTHHPLQALADLMIIYEHFGYLKGLNLAWVGDGNNVLNSLLIAGTKMGLNISAACPIGYEISPNILNYVNELSVQNNTRIYITTKPEEAVKDANIIVTDTWISMGQESEKEKRLESFKGFQVNLDMCKKANDNWIFLHCLPRKKEEVDDEVFYHEKSLVFREAENRKWTTMSVLGNLLTGYTPKIIKSRPIF